MKRYLIERDIPGVGSLDAEQLQSTAKAGNEAITELAGKVQWEQSFVVADKTFCVFRADGEDSLKAHAKLSGFPITKITEVSAIIDPMSAP
ncbi:DUF4242 domain-containing protein [Variovorax sp. N23]|uniref:DUF4242 domain-containing protein n=1 Tax=Variovorax sp. N23 TaxID=2980555 RepID=UPI000F7BFD2D|nr:DUF4242 domain-containing protein [Variovorax sp. N23]AZP50072.1 DUF4242 domain-containing protein [Rahnella aquatilis]MCU4119057.1 DUF4242 domain-containing protein [Variovorax sp. N23]